MSGTVTPSLHTSFDQLADPRRPGCTFTFPLEDILFIALCAAIGGANDWVAVETFGKAKRAWFQRFLNLEQGIPSHDTFGRVFARLNPQAFQNCFRDWIAGVCERLGIRHVAIDGKRLAGSQDAGVGTGAIHLVSAWATDVRLTLGQVAVDEKSNEITAIPKLLEMLEIAGALATIDAMGCQKEIAATIRGQQADYVLAVKENQPHLYEDIERLFAEALQRETLEATWDCHASQENSHGRDEMRLCWVHHELEGIRDRHLWKDLQSAIVIVTERVVGDKSSNELRYYISSRKASAATFAQAIRRHWGIENECHWVLDVVFQEDGSRIRKGQEAENVGWLRRMVLSMLKQVKGKRSLAATRLAAGWNEEFLEQILLDLLGN
ncbi:MAG: ISAs1 family transposase [Terriglobia bacterium]